MSTMNSSGCGTGGQTLTVTSSSSGLGSTTFQPITVPMTGATGAINSVHVIGGGGGGGVGSTGNYYMSTGTGGAWTAPNQSTITISGNSPKLKTEKNEIDLDELAELTKIMKERLLILIPNFEKHEKYAALKKAYDHYKMIEALIQEEKKDDK